MAGTRRGAYHGWSVLLATSVVAVLTATLVAYATVDAFAVEPVDAATDFTVQAEKMTLDPSTAGKVAADSGAWRGEYMFNWSNAKATKSITTTKPVDEVVLRARGEQCEGAPRATVLIDGTQVMEEAVDSETWAYYVASTSLPAGTHMVEVHFTNDHYPGLSCDRNLMVDQVSFNAVEPSLSVTEPPPFYDGFERDADEFGSPWSWVDSAYPDRLTTSSAVARKGTHSAKFTVHDDDVAPLTPTENPRAQFNSGKIFCGGDERWVGSSVYFPSDFPTLPSGGWLVVGSHGFASPYNGSSPSSFTVRSPGNELMLTRDESYGRDVIWRTPLQKGRWMDLVMHTKFSRDPSVGYVELWMNGQRQTFSNGQQQIYYSTLKKDSTGCGELIRTNYRKKGMFNWATVYHDEVKVGTSYEAVAP